MNLAIDVVRAQLDRGVDPNLRDDPSRAFGHANRRRCGPLGSDTLKSLISIQRGATFTLADKLVGNVLHYAAFHGRTKIGALLIAHGLHVDSRDPHVASNAAAVATSHLKHEIAHMLIEAGDVNAGDLVRFTPLDCASLYQDTTTADLIRQSGGKHCYDESNAMEPPYPTTLSRKFLAKKWIQQNEPPRIFCPHFFAIPSASLPQNHSSCQLLRGTQDATPDGIPEWHRLAFTNQARCKARLGEPIRPTIAPRRLARSSLSRVSRRASNAHCR